MALITISEVITAAYTRKVDVLQFKAVDIEAAEFRYIRDALGENLYNEVVADTTTYSTFISTYIKPCLAYFVKYSTFEQFFSEISDRGVNHLTGQNFQTVSNAARTDAKTEVLSKANILLEKMIDYVQNEKSKNNSLFVKYGQNVNVIKEKKIIGGLLI
jgi:hypothetical protein